jgi:hypothetical protein
MLVPHFARIPEDSDLQEDTQQQPSCEIEMGRQGRPMDVRPGLPQP